jgi:hypothetical protein
MYKQNGILHCPAVKEKQTPQCEFNPGADDQAQPGLQTAPNLLLWYCYHPTSSAEAGMAHPGTTEECS